MFKGPECSTNTSFFCQKLLFLILFQRDVSTFTTIFILKKYSDYSYRVTFFSSTITNNNYYELIQYTVLCHRRVYNINVQFMSDYRCFVQLIQYLKNSNYHVKRTRGTVTYAEKYFGGCF